MLLQIFAWFWQWKNFENRLLFDKVKGFNKNCHFLGHPVMLKAKWSEKNLRMSKNSKILTFYGAWRSGIKSSNFYCKRHILAWIHVVWAILRKGRLGSNTYIREGKVRKFLTPIGVSPLTQGLNYRSDCDTTSDVNIRSTTQQNLNNWEATTVKRYDTIGEFNVDSTQLNVAHVGRKNT